MFFIDFLIHFSTFDSPSCVYIWVSKSISLEFRTCRSYVSLVYAVFLLSVVLEVNATSPCLWHEIGAVKKWEGVTKVSAPREQWNSQDSHLGILFGEPSPNQRRPRK